MINHQAIYRVAKEKFGITEASISGDETFILIDNLGNEYTNADFTQDELDAAKQALIAEAEAKLQAETQAKQALLDKLGITADEAKLLLS